MNPLGKYNNSIQGPAIGDPIRISSRAPPSRTNFSLKKNKKTQMAKSVLPNGRLKTAVYKRTGDTVGVFTSTRIQILKTKEEKKNGDILKTGGILNSFLFFFFFFLQRNKITNIFGMNQLLHSGKHGLSPQTPWLTATSPRLLFSIDGIPLKGQVQLCTSYSEKHSPLCTHNI